MGQSPFIVVEHQNYWFWDNSPELSSESDASLESVVVLDLSESDSRSMSSASESSLSSLMLAIFTLETQRTDLRKL